MAIKTNKEMVIVYIIDYGVQSFANIINYRLNTVLFVNKTLSVRKNFIIFNI